MISLFADTVNTSARDRGFKTNLVWFAPQKLQVGGCGVVVGRIRCLTTRAALIATKWLISEVNEQVFFLYVNMMIADRRRVVEKWK